MMIETIINFPIASNSYVIFDAGKKGAIIIDPFESKQILRVLQIYGLSVNYIILTHEHSDHIAGVSDLREIYDCKLVASELCSNRIQDPKLNISLYFAVLLCMMPNMRHGENYRNYLIDPFACKPADITFKNSFIFEWEDHRIQLYETPGHSEGSICFLIDEKWLFTGDSLLLGWDVVTKLPGGSRKKYEEITLVMLKKFSKDLLVYPGHGESFRLGNIM